MPEQHAWVGTATHRGLGHVLRAPGRFLANQRGEGAQRSLVEEHAPDFWNFGHAAERQTDVDVEEIIFLGVGFDSRDETLSITEKRKGNILRTLDT